MMGGACSSMRRHSSSRRDPITQNNHHRSHGEDQRPQSPVGRRISRHSVVSALPNESISNLYPKSDNYVNEDNGKRSPKSLADLCTDTLCRNLPLLDGELPSGLPQDVVNDLLNSLLKHNALNATTLRVLKNCELGSLSLAGCRGVTDEWLTPLSSSSSPKKMPSLPPHDSSSPYYEDGDGVDCMDLDSSIHEKASGGDIFYNANHSYDEEQHSQDNSIVEESSCSTSSFVSASSTHHHFTPTATVPVPPPSPPNTTTAANDEDHPMKDHHNSRKDEAMLSPSFDHDHGYDLHEHYAYHSNNLAAENSTTASMTLLDLRGSQRLTDKGLIQLSNLSCLEVARLDNCHSIVGRGLLAFSVSHRLHTLSLANCRRLTDEAIVNISHLNSLEALSLDGCRCLTDRSLAAIGGLYRLKKLDLSQCDLLTDAGFEELSDLCELEELGLGWVRLLSDNGIDTLTKQAGRSRSLRILGLSRCPITDRGVGYLQRLENLEELNLNGCAEIGSAAMGESLSRMTKLTNLDVSYCPGILRTSWQGKIRALKSLELCYSGVRDSHLSRLTNLPALEELNFDSCPVGDWAVSHLADNEVVPNLTSLDLADTDLTDMGMVHIAKFAKLKRLSLFYCNITNSGLRHLSHLSFLEVLNLDSREIGDDGLWHLRNLKKLKSLDIFSGRITDAGCSHLAKIKSLESVELCGGGISDLGCTMLATLDNLTSLNLSQNERITNRGAAALAALSNLKALNLSNTRVNYSALIHFSDMTKLQSLALYGCRGIEESKGLDRLQNGLPSLKCIRLNNGSDQDGIMSSASDEESDDEVLDSDNEQFMYGTGANPARYYDSDSDDDSNMDDAPVAYGAGAGRDSY